MEPAQPAPSQALKTVLVWKPQLLKLADLDNDTQTKQVYVMNHAMVAMASCISGITFGNYVEKTQKLHWQAAPCCTQHVLSETRCHFTTTSTVKNLTRCLHPHVSAEKTAKTNWEFIEFM